MSRSSIPFSLCPLDRRFVGPKPKEWPKADETLKIKKILTLEDSGHMMRQRKRNGHCAYIAVTGRRKNPVGIYSRGELIDWTEKFPIVVEEVRSMNITGRALFATEMILELNGTDEPTTFGRISGSKSANAIALQKEYPAIQVRIFNTIAHKNKLVIGHTYQDRYDIIREVTAKHHGNIDAIEVIDLTFEEAQALVLKNKWEGLVVYDTRASSEIKLDERAVEPPRPYGCWKWKPIQEDDFIVTGWTISESDSFAGFIKDLLISQYDRSGTLVSWGRCGTGLTSKERAELVKKKCPFVAELAFERRTVNSKLIFSRFLRVRDDKSPKECIFPRE